MQQMQQPQPFRLPELSSAARQLSDLELMLPDFAPSSIPLIGYFAQRLKR